MRGITLALIFVLALNAIFFWGQEAICDINPATCTQFFTYQGSHIQSYDTGNYTVSDDPTAEVLGISQQATVSGSSGNIFTDAWSAITNWFLSITGIKYLIAIVNTVPNFLKAIGLPGAFAFGVGYMWYAFSIWVIITFVRGSSE
jgi:hypothetical protein